MSPSFTPNAFQPPFITSVIIPTGIGASVGGYAGDAGPVLQMIAGVSDLCITHPNVVNAAVFLNLPENTFYVEGYGLDQFFRGHWGLAPVRQNKIGIIFDSGMLKESYTLQHQTVHALISTYGISVHAMAFTRDAVQLDLALAESGASTGSFRNPETILKAARELKEEGCTAIALCLRLPEPDEAQDSAYQQGNGCDPIGGLESILSHLVVSALRLPAAHAPVFDEDCLSPISPVLVDPRAAAEFIAPTYLPCVLLGLSRAPQFVDLLASNPVQVAPVVTINQLSALVLPGSALGGLPCFEALQRGIPVIAVSENKTKMAVSGTHLIQALDALGEDTSSLPLYAARSYYEAVGLLQALKLGQALPERVTMTQMLSEILV